MREFSFRSLLRRILESLKSSLSFCSMFLLHNLHKKYPLFECPCFPVSSRVTLSGNPQNMVDGFARVGLKFLWGLQGATWPSPGWLPIVTVDLTCTRTGEPERKPFPAPWGWASERGARGHKPSAAPSCGCPLACCPSSCTNTSLIGLKIFPVGILHL